MPIVPAIYLGLLFVYFTRKEKRIGLASILTLFFLISSIAGIFFDIFDLYGEYGIGEKVISPNGTLLYCIGLTAILYPFSNLRITEDTLFIEKKPYFNILAYILIVCFFIYVISHISTLITYSKMSFYEIKAAHYEDLAFAQDNERGSLFLMLPNIISNTWSLSLLCWFVSITFMRNHPLINIGLFLSSTQHIIQGFMIAGRAPIIYWIFAYLCYWVLFKPYMSEKCKHRLFLLSAIAGGAVLVFFMIITASRFAMHTGYGTLYSLLGYAGQPYNNFCMVIEYGESSPFFIDRLLPVFSKYILKHEQFHLALYYDEITSYIGIAVNCFYTLLGGLYLNVGYTGLLICLVIYEFCATKTMKAVQLNFSFSNLILLSILILVPIQGMFDIPFPYVQDTLANLFCICVYFVFKYTLKK